MKTNRNLRVYVAVSTTEMEALKKAADAAGLPVSSWMRVVCLKETKE